MQKKNKNLKKMAKLSFSDLLNNIGFMLLLSQAVGGALNLKSFCPACGSELGVPAGTKVTCRLNQGIYITEELKNHYKVEAIPPKKRGRSKNGSKKTI